MTLGGEPGVPIHLAVGIVVHVQQGMMGEVARRAQRVLGLQRERRAADREQLLAKEPQGSSGCILGSTIADGYVDALAFQVDCPVGGGNAHVDVRMQCGEGAQARDQP
ncbi:MAG TPA: hypothetical protein VFY92_11225 [Hyphomicrobiaceae bacterium]|nr:hypothetical protein [Hyphomicrobiaceae bacterium]